MDYIYKETASLEEGMIVGQLVASKDHHMIAQEGMVLDRRLIDMMRKFGIFGIYIKEKTDDSQIPEQAKRQIEESVVEDRSMVSLTDSVKERVAEGIQYIYNNAGSMDLTEPSNIITDELISAINKNDAVAINVNALKISDEYTFKHSVDVATIAMIIAKQYGYKEASVREIGLAGLLHDIGKSQVPLQILNKPDRLTKEEFEVMKKHSVYGYQILKNRSGVSAPVLAAVLQHHEKLNGRGYPLGSENTDITAYARVLSVADIYDALVTERPYKTAYTPSQAVEMIMAMTEELDIKVVQSFLSSVILYPVGSDVMLSNGEPARVVKNNPHCVLRPDVVGLRSGKLYRLADDLSLANVLIL